MLKRNERMVLEFKSGATIEELADSYDLTEGRVRQVIRPSQYKKRLSDCEREEIKQSYYSDTSTNLAKQYGVSRSLILKIWREAGLKGKDTSRMYYANFGYFEEKIDSEKAYILGFLMADGTIYNREGHQSLVQLTVSSTDVEVLEHILAAIEATYPINNTQRIAEDGVTDLYYSSISITSDRLADSLKKYGILPNKSTLGGFHRNMIPSKYWIDFIAGYFDGDGSITKPKSARHNSAVGVSFDGNSNICKELEHMLSSMDIDSSYTERYQYDSSDLFKADLALTNMTSKYCFLKEYVELDFTLSRKRERAENFIWKVEKNISNRLENKKAVIAYQNLNIKA